MKGLDTHICWLENKRQRRITGGYEQNIIERLPWYSVLRQIAPVEKAGSWTYQNSFITNKAVQKNKVSTAVDFLSYTPGTKNPGPGTQNRVYFLKQLCEELSTASSDWTMVFFGLNNSFWIRPVAISAKGTKPHCRRSRNDLVKLPAICLLESRTFNRDHTLTYGKINVPISLRYHPHLLTRSSPMVGSDGTWSIGRSHDKSGVALDEFYISSATGKPHTLPQASIILFPDKQQHPVANMQIFPIGIRQLSWRLTLQPTLICFGRMWKPMSSPSM